MGVGQMRESLAFEFRPLVDDGYGNMQSGDFRPAFECAAQVSPLKGGETVLASRLTGVQPFAVTIRYSTEASQVTPAWRARDTRTGVVYDITTVAARSRLDYIDMTCVVGKAA